MGVSEGPRDDLSRALRRLGRGARSNRGRGGRLLIGLGGLVLLSSLAFLAYVRYSAWQLSHVVSVAEAAPVVSPESVAGDVVRSVPSSATVVGPLQPASRIEIGSIELDAKVVELGTRVEGGVVVWDTAAHAVGWYHTTALPGQGSNIVMSGHISSPLRGEGSIFRRLPEVRLGDVVALETPTRRFLYEVSAREIVLPTAIGVMAPTATEVLTLITCYPDLVYSHRLVVKATPLEGEVSQP